MKLVDYPIRKKKCIPLFVYRKAWVCTASSFLLASVSPHLSTSGLSFQRLKTKPFWRPASFLLRETRWELCWRVKTLRSKRLMKGKAADRKLKAHFSEWVRGQSHRTRSCVCLQCFDIVLTHFYFSVSVSCQDFLTQKQVLY